MAARGKIGMNRGLKKLGLMAYFCAFLVGNGLLAHSLRPSEGIAPSVEIPLQELMVRQWTIDDGLPSDSVLDVLQSADGYLWVATYEGLARFDGKDFEVFDQQLPMLSSSGFLDIEEEGGRLLFGLQECGVAFYEKDNFGRLSTDWDIPTSVWAVFSESSQLWVGTVEFGAFKLADGEFTRLQSPHLDEATIREISRDGEGALWFATEDNGLVRYQHGRSRAYTRTSGLASDSVHCVVPLEGGGLVVGTMDGLNFIKDGEITAQGGLEGVGITQIRVDDRGYMWMASTQGLYRRQIESGRTERLSEVNGVTLASLTSMAWGREGEVWLGSDGGGLIQLQERKFRTYRGDESLSVGKVNVTFQLDTERFLLGNYGGRVVLVDESLAESRLTLFSTQTDLPRVRVRDFLRDRQGRLWIATEAGILIQSAEDEEYFDLNNGLESENIRDLFEMRDGVVWVGTRDRGLLKFVEPGEFQRFGRSEGLPSDFILDISEDLEGNLLVGTKAGFSIVGSPDNIFTVDSRDGLAGDIVFSLSVDELGAIWACTSGGLSRWQDGQVTNLSSISGLSIKKCFDFEWDDVGGLWLATSMGAVRMDSAEVDAWLGGEREAPVEARIFDGRDGMSHQQSTGASKILKSEDGRLWFSTLDGVSIIDPSNIRSNEVEPPVYISNFAVDGEVMRASEGPLRISPGKRDFTFNFAALSFLAPSRVQVRYRLKGFDSDWIDAQQNRSVRYTNLAPGPYVFEVRAANNDGKWNSETASLQFRVLPRFYQAPAFRWSLGLLGLWGGWQLFNRWNRSVPAVAAALNRELHRVEPRGMMEFLRRRVYCLDALGGAAILKRVAAMGSGRDGPVAELRVQLIHLLAVLFERTSLARTSLDRRAWKELADVLMQQAIVWEAFAEVHEEDGGQAQKVVKAVADQDRLLANIFRADSLAHLAAIQDDLIQLWALPEVEYLYQPQFLNHLVDLWGDLEQVYRLASPEDRTLFLARALTKLLALRELLEVSGGPKPTVDLETKLLALECLRQLVTRELQGVHHQAELSIELNSRVLTSYREAVVTLTIKNLGQGPARGLAVELLPSEESFRTIQHRQQVKSLLRQQAARVEFLVEPKVSDRVRLKFRITYDDLESQGHEHEFADVVEFRQIPVRSTFHPLRPNPYVIGRPLLESDVFIGREEIFARLRASLQGVHQDNVLVIMGPRRMGKTSILRRLRLHLGERYVPILIDLQGMMGSGESAFFRELVATIGDELEEVGIEVRLPRKGLLDREPGTVFRRQFLRKVTETLGDRRLLLIFDEFEVLEERIRSGDLKPQILPYFRSLMQHEEKISFIFAGTHRLDELTRDYWGVLFNLAVYLDVGHLSEKESHQLFIKPTEGFFEIDPLALSKAFQITGGHPHFSQLLARELVEFRNRNKISYVTIQDVNQVAERVAEKGQLHISYLWEDGTAMERQILRTLNVLLERRGIATFNAVQRQLSEDGFSSEDAVAALKQLMRREILQDNAGLLSFRIDLLRLWLDREPDPEPFRRAPERKIQEEASA